MSKKGSSRIRRAVTSSLVLLLVAAVLALSNAYMIRRDRQIALGPHGQDQLQFFIDAVDRPDIPIFFKKLKPSEKLQVARNLGTYDNPALAHLAALWLADFDAPARAELTSVMVKLAATQPEAVVTELKNTGGFQKLAVFKALRSQGAKILPFVVKALYRAEARANAVEYLVGAGPAAGSLVLPLLEASDKDTRLAAVETLGKLQFKPAGPVLLRLFRTGPADERSAYFSALANLGWQGAEATLTSVVRDSAATPASRTAAALGLGKIGSRTSVMLLKHLARYDASISDDAVSGLQLSGDKAFAPPLLPPALSLAVAEGIDSKQSDLIIAAALFRPELVMQAASAAERRPHLVPALVAEIKRVDADRQGKAVASLAKALATTEAGRAQLQALTKHPKLSGFAVRALR